MKMKLILKKIIESSSKQMKEKVAIYKSLLSKSEEINKENDFSKTLEKIKKIKFNTIKS